VPKKLADVESNGQDDVLVDATYSELPGKCMLVLQPTSCSQSQEDGSGSGGGPEIIEAGVEDDGLGRLEDEYFRVQKTVLRSAGFSRTYSSISLSGFNILSSGSTSAFTISVSLKSDLTLTNKRSNSIGAFISFVITFGITFIDIKTLVAADKIIA